MPPPNAFLAWEGGRRGGGVESGVARRESVCGRGGRVCVGGEGERERGKEGESEEERESVCMERESVCGGREVARQKKDVNTHERATKQKRVGIGWFVLWLVVVGCGWLWLVLNSVAIVSHQYVR